MPRAGPGESPGPAVAPAHSAVAWSACRNAFIRRAVPPWRARSLRRAQGAGGGLCSSSFDHDVVVFDGDGKRLGRVRALHKFCSGFHRDGVVHEPHALGIAPGAACADVELPGMPGTADDLTGARILIVAGSRRCDSTREFAARQAATLMRALIGECEELALDIENNDVAPCHLHQLSRPRRDLGGSGDDVAGHGLVLTLGGWRNWLPSPLPCGGDEKHYLSRYTARPLSARIWWCRSCDRPAGKARKGSSKSQCG